MVSIVPTVNPNIIVTARETQNTSCSKGYLPIRMGPNNSITSLSFKVDSHYEYSGNS